MKQPSVSDLNAFARAQMSTTEYTPDKILVDLRFLKDWMVGGLTYMLTKDKHHSEIVRIAGLISERAQSEEYQNRIFDDPSILNPTSQKVRYRDIVDFISNADINTQRTILHISPTTTFLKALSARTVINVNHSVVADKNKVITHTVNCYPFSDNDVIKRIIATGMKISQCTATQVIRRNPEAAPMRVFDRYQHIYMFETQAFLNRESVREVFSLTSQINRRWSMADLYGHETVNLTHPIDKERQRLVGVMQTMTEFELVPSFIFLPVFPESTVQTL